MDRPLTVLLIEDDPQECALIQQYADPIEDIRLIGITNNADKAIEYVADFQPDAIILDLELHKGGGNGISFLMNLKKSNPSFIPYILVTTHNVSSITHTQARQLGADFVMVKSQDGYSAEGVIEFLRAVKSIIHNNRNMKMANDLMIPPVEVKKRINSKIAADIDSVGISPKVKGREYIIHAILLLIEGENDPIAVVARKYEKTEASVNRAMQNAINRAWSSGDIDELHQYYTARIRSSKGVPTLNEFIYFYANKHREHV